MARVAYAAQVGELGRWDAMNKPWPDASCIESGSESPRKILSELSWELGESFELDDYGSMESYFLRINSVQLQYEMGQLTSFNFGASAQI